MTDIWLVEYTVDPLDRYDTTTSTVGAFTSIENLKKLTPNLNWKQGKSYNNKPIPDYWYGDAEEWVDQDKAHYAAVRYNLNEIDGWFAAYIEGQEQDYRK